MFRLTAVVALAAAVALSVSCDDDESPGPSGPDPVENELVFTREDATEIAFAASEAPEVWCGAWEEGLIDVPSLHLRVWGPSDDSRWWLKTVVADVTLNVPLPFPNSYVFDDPKDADLFISDPPNELSTQTGESGGSITFQHLDCDGGGEVEFSIDADVGSEFGGGPPVTVTGTFRAPVGEAP